MVFYTYLFILSVSKLLKSLEFLYFIFKGSSMLILDVINDNDDFYFTFSRLFYNVISRIYSKFIINTHT
jgi:hypothetical protein